MPDTRSRSWRRGAIAASLVVLSLLTAELAARGLMRALGRPYDGDKARALAETWRRAAGDALPLGADLDAEPRRSSLDAGLEIHPYFAWEYHVSAGRVDEDDAYYRSEEAEQTFDVCVLGGSVAAGFSEYASQRLIEVLSSDRRLAGRPIRIHPHARAAYKQPQLLFVLGYLLALGHRPDAVIEIDGFNEAAIATENAAEGTHPVYPSLHYWRRVASSRELAPELLGRFHDALVARRALARTAELFGESGAWRSCVLGEAGILRLEQLRRRSVDAQRALSAELAQRDGGARLVRGPRLPEGAAERERRVLAIWEESSVSMAGLCAAHGIVFLHVLQPTLHDEGSKRWTAEEAAVATLPDPWIAGVRRLYPEMRRAGERLTARGVAFHDASLSFRGVPETLYYDGCHFGRSGNLLLADQLGAALLAALGERGAR